MTHGDVYWVDLPDRGGREQRGRRPSIIWQDTIAFSHLPTVLIIPVTAQQDTLRFGGTVLIQPSSLNRLSSPSVALLFQLGACDVRRIGPRLGRLDDSDLDMLRTLAIQFQRLA